MPEKNSLDYLYQEYERIHSVINTYTMSYFDDLKLLGSLGLVFAWEPIAAHIKGNGLKDDHNILLAGFVVTLAISAIISCHEMLKQSLVLYNFRQLAAYETQIRDQTGQTATGTFRGSEQWLAWQKDHHRYIAGTFFLFYWMAIYGFSLTTLYIYTTTFHVLIYALIAIVIFLFLRKAFATLYPATPPDKNSTP